MGKLKLSTKLWGGFIIVLFLLCIVGFVGISKLNLMSERVNEMAHTRVPQLTTLYDIMEDFDAMNRMVRSLPLTSDQEMNKRFKDQYTKAREELVKEDMPKMENLLKSAKTKELFEAVKKSIGELIVLNDKAVEAGAADRNQEAADIILKQVLPVQAAFISSLKNFQENQEKLAVDNADDSVRQASIGSVTMIAIACIALLVGVVIAFLLVRGITGPLNRVIAGLGEGASQVASASSQVSSSSQQLAEGASEQAASLEETSSSLEELSSMAKQNADNAGQARAMMHEAQAVVEKANRQMGELVDAIDEITKSSEETGKIIKTIDDIAFQTNLLALNAAVEAARAGEAGSGFAVVADEVRNLALRSAEAAKNTSALIEKTIKAVSNGNQLTAATQDAFKSNEEISKKVNQLVDEIATASEEQAHGVQQINTAITDMDKVTQQTAANAEESASASEELNSQSEQMRGFVQELIVVVGGHGAEAAGSNPSAASVTKRRFPVAVARTQQMKSPPAAKVRPQDVIPLHKDEEQFKDF